jgi:hypothetical protein
LNILRKPPELLLLLAMLFCKLPQIIPLLHIMTPQVQL